MLVIDRVLLKFNFCIALKNRLKKLICVTLLLSIEKKFYFEKLDKLKEIWFFKVPSIVILAKGFRYITGGGE